jgi:hypothetical protein
MIQEDQIYIGDPVERTTVLKISLSTLWMKVSIIVTTLSMVVLAILPCAHIAI